MGRNRTGQPSQNTITIKVDTESYAYFVRVAEMLAKEDGVTRVSIPSAVRYVVDSAQEIGLTCGGTHNVT